MCDFRIGKVFVLLLFLINNKTSLKGNVKHKGMSCAEINMKTTKLRGTFIINRYSFFLLLIYKRSNS